MKRRLCSLNKNIGYVHAGSPWGRFIIMLLLAAGLLPAGAFGQTKAWDKTIGGSHSDALTTLQRTPDGGYLLGGSSFSSYSGDKTDGNQGNCNAAFCTNDYWVVKLDADGNKEWDKTFGGSAADFLTTLQPTPDGGYILGGYSGSGISGDKTQASRGGYDYWVVKLDAAGNKEWDKTIGSANTDVLAALQLTPDGGYLLGGHAPSGSSGDKTGPSQGNYDYWVVKLDAAGNKQWDKTFGGSKSDLLASLLATPDGGYLLGGYSESNTSGNKTTAKRGSYDYWIVKLDAVGNAEWDKTYGGSKADILTTLQLSADGGYVLGGYSPSDSDGDKSEDNRGSWDYWVLKLDAAGDKSWDRAFGGPDQDLLTSLQPTPDGGLLLAGNSSSGAGGDKSEVNRGGTDYWLVKLNAAGGRVWDKTLGGSNTDGIAALQHTGDGGYLLAGSSDSEASGDKSQQRVGRTDYWVVKVQDDFAGPPPQIQAFSPEKDVPGTIVTISGRHLAATSAVLFNGLQADFEVISDKEVKATVPVEATSGKISLVTAHGRVISASTFNVRHPGITAFTPASGQPGTTVYLTGDRLTTVKEVYFNNVPATEFQVDSDAKMSVVVPEGATTGRIKVVLAGGGYGNSKSKFLVSPPETTAAGDQKLARKAAPAEAVPGPAKFEIKAFPNPFGQQVTFSFTVARPQAVTVKVYDQLGREVELLYQGDVPANQAHRVAWRPEANLANGIYLIRVQAPGLLRQQKVLLTR